MIKKLRNIIKGYWKPKALVLMYHRVAVLDADIWGIAVTPANFEQHLQVLQRTANVLPLKELLRKVKNKQLRNNSIAITFDDGYSDNFLVAKPLLEKYQLPATFFITTGNIKSKEEFWWDELENIVLYLKHLPSSIAINLGENFFSFDLNGEAQINENQLRTNQTWDATLIAPPSLRCELYLKLWQLLKPLPYPEQQLQLEKIRSWAKVKKSTRPAFQSLSIAQLQELNKTKLVDIGAHTVSHAALANHNFPYQKCELLRNKEFLNKVTGAEISLLAYPYGNYNNETIAAAIETGFEAAFTTEEKIVTENSHPYRMGRFQVKNWGALDFEKQLELWQHL